MTKAKPKAKPTHGLRNRIVEMRVVHSSELQDNEGNWRMHPAVQREALGGILAQVGIADALLAYTSERAGGKLVLIDGHMRTEEFPGEWPVNVLDVDDAEADLLLATLDPLSAMAEMVGGQLSGLLDTLPQADDEGLQRMMADLETQAGLASLMDEVRAELEGHEAATAAAVSSAAQRMRDGITSGHQVTAVIDLDDLPTFERAIRATGLANRGKAVVELCQYYLFTHGARSHRQDEPGGGDGAE